MVHFAIVPNPNFGDNKPPNFRRVGIKYCYNCRNFILNNYHSNYNCGKYDVWVFSPTDYICDGWEENEME